ncbi:tRNA-dependent cyclodipeptide synthase [Streptomyces sp. NPDC089919]|uniref:tRNA-dependent cyclodipeptide synthase n=1 Tax=Streptomyces sp. NPDC089919 TaxID=3155188 RepID=UPI00342BB7B1
MTTQTVSPIDRPILPQPLTTGSSFRSEPFTDHCRVINDEGAHAVIGISPGNSYFTHQRVLDLTRWGLDHFDQVDLVYTDMHVAEMYAVSGYTEEDARRKAVKNLRGVRAKVTAAVEALDDGTGRLRGHAMSDLAENDDYLRIHTDIRDRLSFDADFSETCEALVSRFLSSRGEEPTADQKRVCLDYVCAEVPLFIDSPAILGVPSSLNCYHQLLPMAELLYSRGSGLRASRNQGHAIITPDTDGDTPR